MEQALLERAPAKLNLTLDVLGLRPDGYHELRSVMQTVSLYDDLTVRVNAPEWRIACATASVPHGEDNLILRAAREYVKRAGIETSGIEFALVKRIPMQAGLGGGSADAAACLRALDRIYGALPQDELLDVAASVGSDVPFCLLGGTRLCTGRGEKMTLLRRLKPCHFVVCKPEFSASTPALFRALDENPDVAADGAAEVERAIRAGELPSGGHTNRFEPLLVCEHPVLARALEAMQTAGARLVSLTGTGTACFGLFDSRAGAERCFVALAQLGMQVFLAQPE